ncbi:hypothetical protein PCAR4_90025 [Paraburkholderia caribensis]|nr:hypothetical protein PCAR4_90025 [Paraburkholderia caribensis]
MRAALAGQKLGRCAGMKQGGYSPMKGRSIARRLARKRSFRATCVLLWFTYSRSLQNRARLSFFYGFVACSQREWKRYKRREYQAPWGVVKPGGGRPDGPRKVSERFRRAQETDTDRYVFSG